MNLSNLCSKINESSSLKGTSELKGDQSYSDIARKAGWFLPDGTPDRGRAYKVTHKGNENYTGVSVSGLKDLAKGTNQPVSKVLSVVAQK